MNELTGCEEIELSTLMSEGVRTIRSGNFKILDEARISSIYLDAGYRINVGKLKTHVETEISGCVKNIFGTADTETRKKAHRSRSQRDLADAIVDIFSVRPPEYNILDAVTGMEGNGPSHGSPRDVGWIIASENALAIDWIEATIMGFANPQSIPYIKAASARGLGPSSKDEIELIGADWGDLPIRGFKKSTGLLRLLPTFVRGMAHGLASLRPEFFRDRCIKCGICGKVCPVDAISFRDSYPIIDESKCVRCLCCHEMCPTNAMAVHKNFIARLAESMRGGMRIEK